MKIEPLVWCDDYNVGCDYVDEAHKKLFSIARHVLDEEKLEPSKAQFTAGETIKYLKRYAIQHFSEEEAFMRSIKYPGYEMHKKLHDNLKDVTLVQLEEELVNTNFSEKAVTRLAYTLLGWLSGHIIIEDRAITGRACSRYNHDLHGRTEFEVLDEEFQKFIHDLFRLESKCINQYYSGEAIHDASGFEFVYLDENQNKRSFIVVVEKNFLMYMLSFILGTPVTTMDRDALLAFVQVMISAGRAAFRILHPDNVFTFKNTLPFKLENYKTVFEMYEPKISSLWGTKEGMIGLIIN